MAFIPSESPNITVKEFDLSGVVPAVTTSTGAIVGDFNWGPIGVPTKISNESQLVSVFGSPTLTEEGSAVDYLTAGTFLKYSSDLFVVRDATVAALNSYDSDGASTASIVKNDDDFLTKKSGLATSGHTFIGKHAGILGNNIDIQIVGEDSAVFATWDHASSFDEKPGTSAHVAARSADTTGANDEIHIAVIDRTGIFSGVPGTLLEAFPFVSLATDARTPEGASNYAVDVVNAGSEYVRCASLPDEVGTPVTSIVHTASANGSQLITAVDTTVLKGGANSGTFTTAEYTGVEKGFSLFEDVDTIQVDFLIAPGLAASADQVTVVNTLTGIAALRKDCVVVSSPARTDVVGVAPSTIVTNTITTTNLFNASSYLIVDNNYLKVYDKYNDQYVYIPAASSTAGVMAATDDVAAPWFSPAGSRRGQYYGVTNLAYSATKAQRDTLYKAGVNPIVNLPGQGILLYGDKTKLGRPSAFDRINVRRLFLGVERAIKAAAQNVMFEFNDEFTRAEFVNIIEPFLREIKGRRGITDFRVVCDETNNTAAVIDNNQFIASVFIKPARSINYVSLNFVAVRTGVDFDEVVGLV
tara:strand:+ start:402 stop:2153 length:1752 start_codon:yes stop_codon:yes gene_type:complete